MCLTLGCDPELVCHLNGRFESASNHFKFNSSFGLDGNDRIAEIRPGYSESPLDLTAKIKIILEYGHEKEPELEFLAGHFQDNCPIGGHIHLATEPDEEIVDALDVVLYSLSNCIDDREQREKREKTGYGKKSATQKKPYGFEYRTPGSWLLSPATALVTFTLAKLTVLGVKEDEIDFRELKGRKHSHSFLKEFKSNLKTIPEDCLEGLNELDTLISKRWDWNKNILPNWGIAA
jgi:hypothetical protein